MSDFNANVQADLPPLVAEMPGEAAYQAENQQKAVFDAYADEYDVFYETEMGRYVYEAETRAAMELLNPQAGEDILDVGCGTGIYSHLLAEKGAKVTGIDLSEKMLAQAKAKGSGPKFLYMDVTKLDFPDASFDKVLSMAAFEFIPDVEKAYREIMRILRPGGIAVIGTIARGGSWAEAYSDPNFPDAPYKAAQFKSKEEMIALDPNNVTGIAECLYIPPYFDRFSMEEEMRLSSLYNRGGFIVIRYKKKS